MVQSLSDSPMPVEGILNNEGQILEARSSIDWCEVAPQSNLQGKIYKPCTLLQLSLLVRVVRPWAAPVLGPRERAEGAPLVPSGRGSERGWGNVGLLALGLGACLLDGVRAPYYGKRKKVTNIEIDCITFQNT